MRDLPTITRAEIAALRAKGHAVGIYERKGVAVVDGYKRYRIIETPA